MTALWNGFIGDSIRPRLLLLSGVTAYVAITRLRAAQQRVSHTHAVQVALAEVNVDL